MKLCERNFIRNHIIKLSELTIVSPILLAKLLERKIIGPQDKERLEHCDLPSAKSGLLYDIIARTNGSDTFSTLIRILSDDDLRQTGAVAELKKYSCSECARCEKESLQDSGVTFSVPLQVRHFTGRGEELQRLHELMQRPSSKVTVVSQATTVTGLGGIGKTGLIIEYVKTYSKHYQGNILWINADSAEEVQKCYISLAQTLQIPLKDRSEEPRDIVQVKEDIYAHFVGLKCLFVFDNCTDPAFVGKECIPATFPASFCTLPKFLLTSRNQEWESDVGVLLLDEMKPKEAEDLIMNILSIKEWSEDVHRLAKLLQHFPLGIQQATAYIYDQQRNRNYTIGNYIDDFKNRSEKLLDAPIFGIDNKYKKTTFTTWQISFEQIRKDVTAANILHMMAYMAPDNVDREIFRFSFPHGEDVEDAVKLICKYSLLKGEKKQSVLSIHRLVQEVIRLQLESNGESEAVLRMCLKLLANTNLSETSHPTVIWGKASRYTSLIEQFYDASTAAIERQLTPLHLLGQSGDFEGVESIMKHFRLKGRQDEIDRLDCYGRTPLILACEQGHVKVVKIMLENQARTDIMAQSVRQRKTFGASKNAGRTAMLAAVRSRSFEIVKMLKNGHWDPSKETGVSPAELAASYGEIEMCKELSGNTSVYLCAVMSAKGKEMDDVMTMVRREINAVSKERRSDIIKYLVRDSTLVGHAIKNDYPEDFVWFLIEEAGGLAEAEKVTQTPLFCSVYTGRLDLVKIFIERGSNIDVIRKGLTLLHVAALRGKSYVVEYLIEKNFDVNIRSNQNYTPLHCAAMHGREEVVDILIANGCDCSVFNDFGESPLHCAASYNHFSIVEKILKGIPEGNKEAVCIRIVSRPWNCTMVHLAAAYDNVQLLTYLLDQLCVDGDVDNGQGFTPLHFACFFGSWNAAKYLGTKRSVNTQNTIKPSSLLQIVYDKFEESKTSWSTYEKHSLKFLYCYSRIFDQFVGVTASELGNVMYPNCPLRDARPGWLVKKLMSFQQVRSLVSNVQSKVEEFKRRRKRNEAGRVES